MPANGAGERESGMLAAGLSAGVGAVLLAGTAMQVRKRIATPEEDQDA